MSSEDKNDIMSPAFLLNTLVSLNTALTSIEKEVSQKSDTLYELSGNLRIVAEALKSMKEGIEKGNINISEVKDVIKDVDASMGKHDVYVATKLDGFSRDISEVKSSLIKANAELMEIKSKLSLIYLQGRERETVEIRKGVEAAEEQEEKKEKKQGWFKNVITFLGALSGLKNVNVLLIIILFVVLILSGLLFNKQFVDVIISIIKAFT
jgi:hypothetical protein